MKWLRLKIILDRRLHIIIHNYYINMIRRRPLELTAVFLVTAVVFNAVHYPVAPRDFFHAFVRPAAHHLVATTARSTTFRLVCAAGTISDSVADGRRVEHICQSRPAVTRLFVRAVFTVHCSVAPVTRQHHLSDSIEPRYLTLIRYQTRRTLIRFVQGVSGFSGQILRMISSK